MKNKTAGCTVRTCTDCRDIYRANLGLVPNSVKIKPMCFAQYHTVAFNILSLTAEKNIVISLQIKVTDDRRCFWFIFIFIFRVSVSYT